jgi:hypothetical protein
VRLPSILSSPSLSRVKSPGPSNAVATWFRPIHEKLWQSVRLTSRNFDRDCRRRGKQSIPRLAIAHINEPGLSLKSIHGRVRCFMCYFSKGQKASGLPPSSGKERAGWKSMALMFKPFSASELSWPYYGRLEEFESLVSEIRVASNTRKSSIRTTLILAVLPHPSKQQTDGRMIGDEYVFNQRLAVRRESFHCPMHGSRTTWPCDRP